MVKVCCLCKRYDQGKVWMKGVPPLSMGAASHGYCPECSAQEMTRWMVALGPRQAKPDMDRSGR